ncbi:hypothetical protein [Legionella bozemanae]|uniref:hypothetical protein n=1 Tax=Legionella bozemanae TaxID=447 RepID=UPI001040FC77|nr:hypothetical protein [Legionella bozemanae]
MNRNLKEKIAQLKELEREHSRVYANLFTENNLIADTQQELIESRTSLYKVLDPIKQIIGDNHA